MGLSDIFDVRLKAVLIFQDLPAFEVLCECDVMLEMCSAVRTAEGELQRGSRRRVDAAQALQGQFIKLGYELSCQSEEVISTSEQ